MSFAQEPIFQWLSQFAYQPTMVYFGVIGMMFASSFGFPLPEEVTILSVGVLAYMGANPEHFPPPYAGAPVVNGIHAALITTFAVIAGDFLVFFIGRLGGRKLVTQTSFRYLFTEKVMSRINGFVSKFGLFAVFIFRFTPGIRFPAHVILGMSEIPVWKFLVVDSFAALISVPTQILLVAHYGEDILIALHRFKIWFFSILVLLLVLGLIRKYFQLRAIKRSALEKGKI